MIRAGLPVSVNRRRPLQWLFAFTALLSVPAVVCAAPEGPAVIPAKGWRFQVLAGDLEGVDNLAFTADGALYATLELADGKGRLVRVRNGVAETVVAGLNRPDGLAARGRKLYVTEEVSEGRILEVSPDKGEWQILATLHNPEGIAVLPDGDLILSEDSVNGRLVHLHRRSGLAETIIAGLNRPEGLAVATDGTIYVAETATGRVLAYRNGYLKSMVDDLDEPDQVRLAADGALWITEDTPRARLLRLKDGAVNVILSGLHSPQGMVFTANGALLLAEQGRGRILIVTREEEKRP